MLEQARPAQTRSRPRTRITHVRPVVECGTAPAKRSLGDTVRVTATIFRDGHGSLGGALRYRGPHAKRWSSVELTPLGNDLYEGSFTVSELGRWKFELEAWNDRAAQWRDELRRKAEAGRSDLSSELAEGAELLGIESLTVEEGLASTVSLHDEVVRSQAYELEVDPVLGRMGAWYELFPRGFGGFAGVEAVLPELAELGFDVVYLPPIHPIGRSGRKGKNNTLPAQPGDAGSPWAIGAEEGGHEAVNPELGTLAEFEAMVARAKELGVEIALDFAIQCSPDHPWLEEHPEWFQRRPDGTIKYAENPPKVYEDIVNVDWDSDDWQGLWNALRDVLLIWVERGITVFRVDNPHTKPLPFWEWVIAEVRREHPEVIFLAEAFTRPAMMRALGRAGFNQSYTYFTWRNTRIEIEEYVTELATETVDYFRPNFFANTPDILHEYLQGGGRPAFEARLVLAATLSPSYGIYSGYERCENVPVRPGSEEYLDSEKYEVKERSLDGPLLPLIKRVNAIRRSNRSLWRIDDITFLDTASDALIAYAKQAEADTLIVCVNLDPRAAREGLVTIPAALGLPGSFVVQDLLSDGTFLWQTGGNYVRLLPGGAHILHVR